MLKHQPKALTPLFLTEMWERFGFYTLQGLLVIYLTNYLGLSDSNAYAIQGEYSALVYISPLLGGFFADKVLGFRYSILVGAIFLCLGYAIVATLNNELLYWGLAIVILGNGFLKPNISSYLGEFYQADDPLRDSGFTIFYMGINLGVVLSTILTGFIQQYYGWRITFASASIGMLIGIIAYLSGFKRYQDKGMPLSRRSIKPAFLRLFKSHTAMLAVFVIITAASYYMLKSTGIGHILLIVSGFLLLCWLLMRAYRYDSISRNKLIALLVLILISIIFWGLFFQEFSAVNLFIERVVNRQMPPMVSHFLSAVFHRQMTTIPPTAFISLESVFVIILGAALAFVWKRLHQAQRSPSVGYKFALALFCTATSMFVLICATHLTDSHGYVRASWMVGFYFIVTLGEMLLSPIGLSMVTELAPNHLVGLMMGVWFMALGYGGLLSGSLAQLADVPRGVNNIGVEIGIYRHAFFVYGMLALGAAILTLLIAPWIKKLIVQTSFQARG